MWERVLLEGIGPRRGQYKAGYWQHSFVTHGLMSWQEHLELDLIHFWDSSLKLEHNDLQLIS